MKALNSQTFEQAIHQEFPVAVDFWAEWCMPCKMFAPVLAEIADALDGKAEICKVNIDENMELAQQYNVASIPTVIVYKHGKPVDQMVGVRGKDEVIAMLQKHMDEWGK